MRYNWMLLYVHYDRFCCENRIQPELELDVPLARLTLVVHLKHRILERFSVQLFHLTNTIDFLFDLYLFTSFIVFIFTSTNVRLEYEMVLTYITSFRVIVEFLHIKFE